MAIDDLKARMARLPQQPGVYLFMNDAGETLYVGKARVLRDRVRSYLGAKGISPRHDALLRDAASLEYVVTDSVVEALALENRLIKQRNPRFNVLLRDDKTYPYLQLTTTERAPRLLVARRVERDGNVYAGPFMPARAGAPDDELAHRLLRIRSCNEIIDGKRDRPCLEYDIKRCLAPCVEAICTIERVRPRVEQARLLIEGRQDELIDDLRRDDGRPRARSASSARRTARRDPHDRDAARSAPAHRHDFLRAIATRSASSRPAARHAKYFRCAAAAWSIGASSDRRAGGAAPLDGSQDIRRRIVTAALQQFYSEHEPPPRCTCRSSSRADDQDAVEGWLTERARGACACSCPKRGEKARPARPRGANAAMAYHAHFGEARRRRSTRSTSFVARSPAVLPRRIEGFDISTLQGARPSRRWSSCVEGRMRKASTGNSRSGYRHLGARHSASVAQCRATRPVPCQ
jgi:excinuclease ABC subunit C